MKFPTDSLQGFLTHNASKQSRHGTQLSCSSAGQALHYLAVKLRIEASFLVYLLRILYDFTGVFAIVRSRKP